MTDNDLITVWIDELQSWLCERYDEDDEKFEQFKRCFERLLKEDVTDLKS